MAALVRQGLGRAVDPQLARFMNFTDGSQPLVDAAFLALALLRAPSSLLKPLDGPVRANLVKALRDTRRIKPGYNNWLLFSAMVEALFLEMGEDWDAMRVDLALRTCAEWYAGDSFFKDGPEYHHDYYNSFVIQPFMWTILQVLRGKRVAGYDKLHALLERTTVRYAEVLERGISPEGTFPVYGRSIVYRFGAFQLLAQVALERASPLPSPRRPCARPSPRSCGGASRLPAPSTKGDGSAPASPATSHSWPSATSAEAACISAAPSFCLWACPPPIPSGPRRPKTGRASGPGPARTCRPTTRCPGRSTVEGTVTAPFGRGFRLHSSRRARTGSSRPALRAGP